MAYGLDLTHKEPRLTNVAHPKVFIRENASLKGVATEQEPRYAIVKLHDFRDGVSQRQTPAKMFDVRRLTDGEYRVRSANGSFVFTVLDDNVTSIKKEKI